MRLLGARLVVEVYSYHICIYILQITSPLYYLSDREVVLTFKEPSYYYQIQFSVERLKWY